MSESTRPSEQRKKVLAIALDYDGCVASRAFEIGYEALLKQHDNKSENIPWHEYLRLVYRTQQPLLKIIAEKAKNFDEIMLIVGSNRQSAKIDQYNAESKKNGSAFPMIEALGSIIQKQNQKPVKINKTTFYDFILGQQRGYNFTLTKPQILEPSVEAEYNGGDYKYRSMFLMAHDVCANYPQCDFDFFHFDDRDDIVRKSNQTFQDPNLGSLLPTNLRSLQQAQYQAYNPIAYLYYLSNSVATKQLTSDEIDFISKEISEAISTILKDYEEFIRLAKQFLQESRPTDQQGFNEDEKVDMQLKNATAIVDRLREYKLDNRPSDNDLDGLNQWLREHTKQLKAILEKPARVDLIPEKLRDQYDRAIISNHPSVVEFFPGYTRSNDSQGMRIDPTLYPHIAVQVYKDDYTYDPSPIVNINKIMEYANYYEAQLKIINQEIEAERQLRQKDMALDLRQLFKRQGAVLDKINDLRKKGNWHTEHLDELEKRWLNLPKPSWYDCFKYTMSADPNNAWRDAFLFPKNNGDKNGYRWKVAGYVATLLLGGVIFIPLRFAYKTLIETNALFLENKINHGLTYFQRKITIYPFDIKSGWDWLNYGGSYLAYIAGGITSYFLRSVRVLSRVVTSPIRSGTVGFNTGSEVHPALGYGLAITSGILSVGAYLAGFYFAFTAGASALASSGLTYASEIGTGMQFLLGKIASLLHLAPAVAEPIVAATATTAAATYLGVRELGGAYIDPEKPAPQPNILPAEVIAAPAEDIEVAGFVGAELLQDYMLNLMKGSSSDSTSLIFTEQRKTGPGREREEKSHPNDVDERKDQDSIIPEPKEFLLPDHNALRELSITNNMTQPQTHTTLDVSASQNPTTGIEKKS